MNTVTSRELIKNALAKDPNAKIWELTTLTGITRQRVYQIAAEEGLVLVRRTNEPRQPGEPGPHGQGVRGPAPRVLTGGIAMPLTTTAAGAIGELLVAADLVARGWHVFAPIIKVNTHCDLIAMNPNNNALLRVEVRCARRFGGAIRWNIPEQSKGDIFARVVTGEPIDYWPNDALLKLDIQPMFCTRSFGKGEDTPRGGQ